VIDAEICK